MRLGPGIAVSRIGPAALPLVVAVFLALGPGCRTLSPAKPGAPPAKHGVSIMGPSRLSAADLAAWVTGRQPRPPGVYRAAVPIETLARFYIEEGQAEGVAGDIAFVQAVLETGWFRFGGLVPASANSFAGIGATDTNPQPARFPDARTGVRAHIQHLRAYGDPAAYACTVPPLRRPCVDPRFDLVAPKGRAPTWSDLGGGNWATSRGYGNRILALYDEACVFAGIR
jgi:hypothetical protein